LRDSLRIVTTNFDTHLSAAAEARYGPAIETFSAPALPLGRDFRGIVYLHGSLPRREPLVLTDSDFGRAYLADGWATRFLLEMFEAFTVLFVGYSHSDIVMQYLARGFVNATDRFAFAKPTENDDWTYLGITPVNYTLRAAPDEHGAIRDALGAWVYYAGLGLLDHEQRIRELTAKVPPIDQESIDYLDSVVSNPATLRMFTKHAQTLEWLEWLEERGHLAPLFSVEGPDDPRAGALAEWLATHFAIAHATPVFKIVEGHQLVLGGLLWFAVGQALAFAKPRPDPEILERWVLLLTQKALPTWRTIFLEQILGDGRSEKEVVSQLLLFGYLARPYIVPDRLASVMRDDSGGLRLNIDVALRGDKDQLREAWQHFFTPNLSGVHLQLAPLLADLLEEAHRMLVAAGRADRIWDPMSFRRSAIEPHGQDAYPDPWEILVDGARDVLEWRIVNAPELGAGLVEQWNAAEAPLLRRLAVHGVAVALRLTPDEKVGRVQAENWLHTFALKHEVFHLLERSFAEASEEVQRRFVEYAQSIAEAPEEREGEARQIHDYEKYNLAVWLRHVAPASKVASDYLAMLQAAHPDFSPRDHPDFDSWSGPVSYVTPKSPFSVTELLELPVTETVTRLLAYRPVAQAPGEPDRPGMLGTLQEMAAKSFAGGLEFAREVVRRREFDTDLWPALMLGWRDGAWDAKQWLELLALLGGTPELDRYDRGIADLLDHAADYKGERAADLVPLIESIADRVLSATDSPSAILSSARTDWLTQAINQTGGRLVMVLLKLASKGAPASPPVLRDTTRARLQQLLATSSNNGTFARIVMASQANYLLALDREWTLAHVVPLFDWDREPTIAAQAWAGFAGWGQWSGALFEAMLPATRNMFGHLATELKEDRDQLSSRLAGVAVFSERDPWHGDGWLRDFIRSADEPSITAWGMHVARALEELPDNSESALWTRWLKDYLQERFSGVPKPLSDGELGQVVWWSTALPSQFDEIAELCLRGQPPGALDHFVIYRLDQSGLASSHPAMTARLLRHLLKAAKVDFSCDYLFRIGDACRRGKAAREDLVAVCEAMARLGCAAASELRRLLDEPPEAVQG
jgi:hypothetical protein